MGESVCHAARILGLPAEVMSNALRLIQSVEGAVHARQLGLAAPRVNQSELLESLMQEYCDRL